MNSLVQRESILIGDVVVHQSDNGLYSLTDLWVASGGEQRHRPRDYLKTQQAKEVISEISEYMILKSATEDLEQNPEVTTYESESRIRDSLSNQALIVINRGDLRVTYVCKVLAFYYARWVSAKFFILVVRTLDELIPPQPKAQLKQKYSTVTPPRHLH